MNVLEIKNNDIANWPWVRVSLRLAGCGHRCPGCFSAHTRDPNQGHPFDQKDYTQILDNLNRSEISGLSILGGDPLYETNREQLYEFLKMIKSDCDKPIRLRSGYTLEALKWMKDPIIDGILKHIDVLVDWPFVESKKDLSLRYRGSSNQRVINLSLPKNNNVLCWNMC